MLIYSLIIHNYLEYLKDKKDDKKDNDRFVGNQEGLHLEVMKIKKL